MDRVGKRGGGVEAKLDGRVGGARGSVREDLDGGSWALAGLGLVVTGSSTKGLGDLMVEGLTKGGYITLLEGELESEVDSMMNFDS